MESLIDIVRAYSHRIKDGRNRSDVYLCAGEELGEVAQEIKIANGRSYKNEGSDGIVGEYMDLIISSLDGIFMENPHISVTELLGIALAKCDKWEEKVTERLAKEKKNA